MPEALEEAVRYLAANEPARAALALEQLKELRAREALFRSVLGEVDELLAEIGRTRSDTKTFDLPHGPLVLTPKQQRSAWKTVRRMRDALSPEPPASDRLSRT